MNPKQQRYGNNLRFLKNRNTETQRDVYRNLVSDYINANGVDVIYYRRGLTFFEKNKDKKTADPVYGADPTAPYSLKANMVVFIENLADSYLLNRFGVQTESEVQAYIGIRDFVERFKPILGREVQKQYSIRIKGDLKSGYVSGILNTDEIYGRVICRLPKIVNVDSATLTGLYFEPLPRPKDMLYKKSLAYDLCECTASLFSAVVNIDHKTGCVVGNAVGSITHKNGYADNQSSEYEIRPQVGDLIVLDNEPGMLQERFEITRVDRRAQGSNLIYNPMFDAYCYIVTCVQHRDSYEDVVVEEDHYIQDDPDSFLNAIGSTAEKEELETNIDGVREQISENQEYAKDQFDYSQNDDKDNAYGGYGS